MTTQKEKIFLLPYVHILDVPYTHKYRAQHRSDKLESSYGYDVVKLDTNIYFSVQSPEGVMESFHAKKGEYLAQCPSEPPIIIQTWTELRRIFHVFRKDYRYILNGMADGSYELSDFRLIAGVNIRPSYSGVSAIRVHIPDDVRLTKYSCDPYSTTDDKRTLDELGYDVVIWNKMTMRWIVHNEFKGIPLHEIPSLYPFHKMKSE